MTGDYHFRNVLFLLFLVSSSKQPIIYMAIAENIALLRKEIPSQVQLIAVSKTMPVAALREAYEAGQRSFGENKVQEVLMKQPLLPSDIEWHLIGHLQSNKVKSIVPFVKLIHSVDSLKLLGEINKEAGKINKVVDCLLQIHIALEETKFGLSYQEAKVLVNSAEFKTFRHVRLTGLMGMATFTDDFGRVGQEFMQLAGFFKELKTTNFADDVTFRELSMGMSGDFKQAIEAGSTMVRIGSLIFGERNYNQ
jgi:pyridoxal phosphate enzyme (YggS family)